MVKRKRKKSKNNGRSFAIFTLILFIGSALGYALLSSPGNTQTQTERVFLSQNIFDTPISNDIKQDVLLIENPNTHPNIDSQRQVGGVWIEYSCSDCTNLISNLTKITNDYYPRVYLSPNFNLTSQISTTSMAQKQDFDTFNNTAIRDFICKNLAVMPPDTCALRNLRS